MNRNTMRMKGKIKVIEITNGYVFDPDIKSFKQQTLTINSNEEVTIDAQNKYIIPGLTDMHTHISPFYAKYYLLSSITNVRNTAGMYELINSIDEVSPNIFPTYKMIDGEPGLWGPSGEGHITTNDIEEAMNTVKELHAQGAKFIKVYGNIETDVLVAVVNQAKQLGLEVAADLIHAQENTDALHAVSVGVKYLEHASGIIQCLYREYKPGDFNEMFLNQDVDLDSDVLNKTLDVLKENDVVIVPTLSLYRKNAFGKITVPNTNLVDKIRQDQNVTLDEMFEKLEPSRTSNYKRYAEWEYAVMKIITKRYIDMSGKVYIGTDAPAGFWNYPGYSMIEEMNIFNELGLSPSEVLHRATVMPMEVIGKHENYVILNNNPLDSFDHLMDIYGIVLNGKYYAKEEIESHTIDAAAIYKKFES